MDAAAAMDFHALSRRELQALCKRNGVRANMTNAAMAEALQGLTLVDGIDEIRTTLCLPTPGRSAMKSAVKTAEMAGEEQQHGSPLPRGRRVSVKSPEAIRMEVEEGEDEMKRDLVKEIVKTPGVALRSTSRRARATPAPLPTPVPASSARATARRTAVRKMEEVAPTPATIRRSQRAAARKGTGTMEVDQSIENVSAAKRLTRSARSKVKVALEQEDEVVAAASKEEEKILQEEPKAIASDVKCDDPEDEEVTKVLEGDNKEEKEEPEEHEKADSSGVAIRSAVISDMNCDDPTEEVAAVMEEQSTEPHEGIVEEQEPIRIENSSCLTVMEYSPILGVISKVENAVPTIEKEHDASVGDGEGLADENILVLEDKEVGVDEEAVKEDCFAVTVDTDPTPELTENILAAVQDETNEDDGMTEAKGLQSELLDDKTSEEDEEEGCTDLKEGDVDEMPHVELVNNDSSGEIEDDGFTGMKEGAALELPQADLADDEAGEEDDLDDDEEWTSEDGDSFEENGSSDESDEVTGEYEDSCTGDVAQGTVLDEGVDEDASTEDDDINVDLTPEFVDNTATYSDAETESDIAAPVLEENQAPVKSLDDTETNAEHQKGLTEEANATDIAMKEVDNIVKSLDEFTLKEDAEAKEMQKQPQVKDYDITTSLRKLKVIYKNRLIALKETKEEVAEGKRLPLEEVDDNARLDC